MKNWKTYLMILLAFCMVVMIAACGGGEGDNGDGTTAGQDATTDGDGTTTPEDQESTTPEDQESSTPDKGATTDPGVNTTDPGNNPSTPPDDDDTDPVDTLPAGDPDADPWVDDPGDWTHAPEVVEPTPAE